MEKFKKSISRRISVCAILLVFVLGLSFIRYFVDFELLASGHILDFCMGVMFGAEICIILLLCKYNRAIRSETKLKKLYIEETDERNILIRTKTGGLAVDIITYTIVCAILTIGIFNAVVCYTLTATLMFISILRIVLFAYYENKF